jgi:(4-O-methyl)-D-glucuronate---lignin esterase
MNRIFILILFTTTLLILISCDKQHEKIAGPLEAGFINPPVDARPRGYWCWVDGNVDTNRLTVELKEARDKGMGGYDIWDISPVVDEKNVVPDGPPFMGEESLDAIVYAIKEAGRFGLDIGITYSSGWNAGGPWTTPEHSTMGLFRSFKTVTGPGIFDDVLEFPELPDKYNNNNRWIKRDENGMPVYYKDIATLAFPLNKDKIIEDTSRILNLTSLLQENGKLKWEIPPGK